MNRHVKPTFVRVTTTSAIFFAALMVNGCVSHIAPYRPKVKEFEAGEYAPKSGPKGSSLYAESGRGLFENDIARSVGDTLVIQIDESDSALRDDSTKLSRKGSNSHGLPASLGLLAKLLGSNSKIDPALLFKSDTLSEFEGSGAVSQKGQLAATLPVRVKRELPNGDLYVEGTKVVLVGSDERHVYVSGIVRPADISPDNTVPSSRIADAEIEYTSRGDIADQQRQGWLTRLMNKLWPF